jgi:hypothetical protein
MLRIEIGFTTENVSVNQYGEQTQKLSRVNKQRYDSFFQQLMWATLKYKVDLNYVFMLIYVCTYIYVYVYMCMYVCKCVRTSV